MENRDNTIDALVIATEKRVLEYPLKTLKEVVQSFERLKEEDVLYTRDLNLLTKIKKYVREKSK